MTAGSADATDTSTTPDEPTSRRTPMDTALRMAPPIEVDQLTDPRPWALRLAQVISEVLAGARSPSQLSEVANLDVVRLLERRYGRLAASPGASATRPIVQSVHLSEPLDGVAEACAVIRIGHRVRAIALRLDSVNGRWRCTALRVG